MNARGARTLDGVMEAGILAILILSPLPLGSSLPWAQGAIEIAIALLAALALSRMIRAGEAVLRVTPLLWPGLTFLGIVIVQMLGLTRSASPYATWESARLYVAYLAFLLILGNHLVTRARVLRLVWVLVAWGGVLAAFGLVHHAVAPQRLLWMPKEHYLDRLTATFVNPNHQALYLSIVFFLALGMLARQTRRRRRHTREPAPPVAWEVPLTVRMFLMTTMVVVAAAVLLTGSRGGFIATLVGLAVVVMLTVYSRSTSLLPVLLVGGAVLFVVYMGSAGLDRVGERFHVAARENYPDARWAIWESSGALIREAPVLGVGLGSFQDAYRVHQPMSVWWNLIVDHAHNEYIQLMAETGMVGVATLAWAIWSFVAFVIPRWAVRRDPGIRGAVVGGIGALAAVLAHSVTDFGLHMPANALLVVALLAVLPALVTLRLGERGYQVDLSKWTWSLSSMGRRGLAFAGLAACVAGILLAVPPTAAEWLARPGQVAQAAAGTHAELAARYRRLNLAAGLDPWNPRIQEDRGRVAWELGKRAWSYGVDVDGRRVSQTSVPDRIRASRALFLDARIAYEASLRSRPRSGVTHDRYAWFLADLERVRQTVARSGVDATDPELVRLFAPAPSLMPEALDQMRLAIRWDPVDPNRHRDLGLFALANRQGLHSAPELVAEGFSGALYLEPSMLPGIVDILLKPPVKDLELLRASVPRQSAVTIQLARELEHRGYVAAATDAFEAATEMSAAEGVYEQVAARRAYGDALLARRDADGAVAQFRQALVLAPRDPKVFMGLGNAYELRTQWQDADEAFRTAVSLAAGLPVGELNVYRNRFAYFLVHKGDIEQAMALQQSVVRDAPSDPWARIYLAYLLHRRSDDSGAFRELREAQNLGGRDADVLTSVASGFARQNLFREAIEAYEAAAQLGPLDADRWMELAQLYSRVGRREPAIGAYRQVLARQPDHKAAQQALLSLGVDATSATVRP